ncbi:MAG: endonuclease domain-containing protein [Hyphomonadaceae bacterium]
MTVPTKGMLRDRARDMRKQQSRAERAVWEMVRDRRLGAKFRRQFPIDRYIADFACVEAKLVLEVDGLSHEIADQIAYDAERTSRLNELGWRVLRVRDGLILSEPQRVADRIRATLAQRLN